jgi:hypothetical protein
MSSDDSSSSAVPLFAAGCLSATANANRTVPPAEVLVAMARHLNGDWGDVSFDDWRTNDRAVVDGSRIVSVYHTAGVRFYVVTEADRCSTTVLLPEDY